jgi:hypothetical protein
LSGCLLQEQNLPVLVSQPTQRAIWCQAPFCGHMKLPVGWCSCNALDLYVGAACFSVSLTKDPGRGFSSCSQSLKGNAGIVPQSSHDCLQILINSSFAYCTVPYSLQYSKHVQ